MIGLQNSHFVEKISWQKSWKTSKYQRLASYSTRRNSLVAQEQAQNQGLLRPPFYSRCPRRALDLHLRHYLHLPQEVLHNMGTKKGLDPEIVLTQPHIFSCGMY